MAKNLDFNRVIRIANHVTSTQCTIREAAKKFAVSKTTVHLDLNKRLPLISPDLAREVNQIIKKNLENRHIRGGEATKQKFQKICEAGE